ncbi:FadR/GntR family transcriptional regulator [Mycobacterium angelicum]|uniref:GntR family transcriptional regulator n=1 Tax=Mycobacterium angelicum TaxID=470074 RepID=A0A1W9Z7H0_MYCAN|nr:FCD domain-containing protein [Mycobacterium angelicum]MCV7196517.1 FadR family transcriptional regulator [Mycobacterium angelicum]ORA08259.1 GntR family transcriptional regulator [Mycobacterium angelicum]
MAGLVSQLVPGTRTTLAAQAAAQIRERIESKQWPVGTKLPSELELAEALGVARNTVREALRSLTHLGVLEARAGDGTYVRIATELGAVLQHRVAKTKPEEVLELRALLEQHAIGQAAQRRTTADLKRIRALLADLRKARKSGDRAAHTFADSAFHLAAVRAGGNDFLAEIYEQVTAAFGEFLTTCEIDDEAQADHEQWHDALVDAIAAGDSAAAQQAAAAVVDISRRNLPSDRKPSQQ